MRSWAIGLISLCVIGALGVLASHLMLTDEDASERSAAADCLFGVVLLVVSAACRDPDGTGKLSLLGLGMQMLVLALNHAAWFKLGPHKVSSEMAWEQTARWLAFGADLAVLTAGLALESQRLNKSSPEPPMLLLVGLVLLVVNLPALIVVVLGSLRGDSGKSGPAWLTLGVPALLLALCVITAVVLAADQSRPYPQRIPNFMPWIAVVPFTWVWPLVFAKWNPPAGLLLVVAGSTLTALVNMHVAVHTSFDDPANFFHRAYVFANDRKSIGPFSNNNQSFWGFANSGGVKTLGCGFRNPYGVAIIPSSGVIVVADTGNHRIQLVDSASGVLTNLAGNSNGAFADGTGTAAKFYNPKAIAVNPLSSSIVVADTDNHRIRLVTPLGVVTTLAGSGRGAFADGTGTASSFFWPSGVAISLLSGAIIVADQFNHRIRLVTPLGVATTLAGSGTPAFADGTGTTASFNYPSGVAVSLSNLIVVADKNNNCIRLVTPLGLVTTLAGNSLAGFADSNGRRSALFSGPSGVSVIPSSGMIVVADTNNNCVRAITSLGVVSTLAGYCNSLGSSDGVGTAARFSGLSGIAAIPSSNALVVADTANNCIRISTSVLPDLPSDLLGNCIPFSNLLIRTTAIATAILSVVVAVVAYGCASIAFRGFDSGSNCLAMLALTPLFIACVIPTGMGFGATRDIGSCSGPFFDAYFGPDFGNVATEFSFWLSLVAALSFNTYMWSLILGPVSYIISTCEGGTSISPTQNGASGAS